MWQKQVWMVAAGAALLASGSVMADSLDLNLNDDSLRMTYEADMGRGVKGLLLDAGYFYNDTRKTDRSDADMTHVGLYVSGDNWSQAGVFNIKVGGRLVYAAPGPYNVMALGLGGEFRFSPVHRLGLGASAYYAPRIATFMDGEHYSEFGAKIDYQLLQNAYVYLGYREIDMKVENSGGKFKLDQSGHVGLKLTF